MEANDVNINLPHHSKTGGCTTRAAYRQGKKLTAVKVYTISDESLHLLIYNVPALGLDQEVHSLCLRFGKVLSCQQVTSLENIEEFTNVYHVHYETLKTSRFAKRKLDNRAFFGSVLHVCYAPELETVEETKDKLATRRKEVSFQLLNREFPRQFKNECKYQSKKKKFEEKSTRKPKKPFKKTNKQNFKRGKQLPPGDLQLPGPSNVKVMKKTVDATPFRKLIPTQVSRIILHNKKNEIKTENVKQC